jgi:SAM-dependent methyltransferase
MDEEKIGRIKKHIFHYQDHLTRWFTPIANPAGKRVLIIGSGWGTEILWSLANGASYVTGLDPADRSEEPLRATLSERKVKADGRFRIHRETTQTFVDDTPYDLILSNNVMEHVDDIAGTLRSCRKFITNKGGRIAIFADPLFYSSAGAHLPIEPWAHLTKRQSELNTPDLPGHEWHHYRHSLNGMTLTDFLSGVREAGLSLEYLSIVPDRNRTSFTKFADLIPPGIKPMDLLCEGVVCSLAFPHNL